MNAEYIYLALSVVVFVVGLLIGIMLLRKSMKEQIDYEQQLRQYAGSAPPTEPIAPPPMPPTGPVGPAPGPAPMPMPMPSPGPTPGPAPGPVQTPGPAPGPVGAEASPAEAEAKAKIESTKGIVEQMKGEGMDVTSAEKLLQLATSCLYSGDYERALKYANKSSKVSKDIRERAAVEHAGTPTGDAAAAAEDPQQKEVVATISAVQSKIGPLGESVEKSEVENLLRLATSFVRSKSYSKALRYAKQAEEKANALSK
jgi:hypothetical protein